MATPEKPSTRFSEVRTRIEAATVAKGISGYVVEFLAFGFKQGWACLFGALMLLLLLATHFLYPTGATLHRYDFLTITAVIIQIGMIALRLETWDEVKVIAAFHIVGTVMELFKTAAGSWIYPEASVLHIGAVPLFSGFMYAAVGSYIARVWRIFDFRFKGYPSHKAMIVLATAIYINFFTHHWLPDVDRAICSDRHITLAMYNLVQTGKNLSTHASARRFVSCRSLHLVCRKSGDICQCLDIPRSGRRMAYSISQQTWCVVSTDYYLVRIGINRRSCRRTRISIILLNPRRTIPRLSSVPAHPSSPEN